MTKYIICSIDRPTYFLGRDPFLRFSAPIAEDSPIRDILVMEAEAEAVRFDFLTAAQLEIFMLERSSALATSLNLIVVPIQEPEPVMLTLRPE